MSIIHSEKMSAEQLTANIVTNDEMTTVVKIDEIEIILRSHLLELLESSSSETQESFDDICKFLDSAIKLCLTDGDEQYFSKIPFLLIEDALDCLDGIRCKKLWLYISDVYKTQELKLEHPKVFARSKVCVFV